MDKIMYKYLRISWAHQKNKSSNRDFSSNSDVFPSLLPCKGRCSTWRQTFEDYCRFKQQIENFGFSAVYAKNCSGFKKLNGE